MGAQAKAVTGAVHQVVAIALVPQEAVGRGVDLGAGSAGPDQGKGALAGLAHGGKGGS